MRWHSWFPPRAWPQSCRQGFIGQGFCKEGFNNQYKRWFHVCGPLARARASELRILRSCDYIYCQLTVHSSHSYAPPLFSVTIDEYNSATRQCHKPRGGAVSPSTLPSLLEVPLFIPFPARVDGKQGRVWPGMEFAPWREQISIRSNSCDPSSPILMYPQSFLVGKMLWY
jgi:hypothetical protein